MYTLTCEQEFPIINNGNICYEKKGDIITLVDLKRRNNKHGPNLPAIFTFSLGNLNFSNHNNLSSTDIS